MNPWRMVHMLKSADVHGGCHPAFEGLRRDLALLQAWQPQGGAALAVYHRGHKVADLWTGWQSAGQPWQADTLSMSYSTGKGVLATLAHRLVDQGLLDYDAPVVTWWPEFGQAGKQALTLRQVMSHSAGLDDVRSLTRSAAELLDWPLMLERLAQARPRFEPGSAVAYQALSFGYLVGGIIEKATGVPLSQALQQYLTTPLELDQEAFFGVPDVALDRVALPFAQVNPTPGTATASIAPSASPKPSLTSVTPRPLGLTERLLQWSGQDLQDIENALRPKAMGRVNWFGSRALQACMPSMNGVFSARALARHYAVLAGSGEFEGRRWLSPQTFAALSTVQNRQRDRVMPIPMHWRLGYHRIMALGAARGFGHIGYNGSGGWCDPSRELAFAYIQTYPSAGLTGDPRLWALSQRVLRLADRR